MLFAWRVRLETLTNVDELGCLIWCGRCAMPCGNRDERATRNSCGFSLQGSGELKSWLLRAPFHTMALLQHSHTWSTP